MDAPEYLICLECETPCYTFDWGPDGLTEVQCMACGCDQLEQFMSEEEFEAMQSAS